jgi:Domain of unknown function (DUF4394)/PEP-CTERM motif
LTCLSTAFVLAIGTVPVRAESVIGLTSANSLVTFDSLTPGVVSAAIPITGVGAETIFDIDRRPANGLLYGLGSAGNLYLINLTAGAASLIGSIGDSTTLRGIALSTGAIPEPTSLLFLGICLIGVVFSTRRRRSRRSARK